jgi:EAL domain-containing protein (putative c-di-GMP-specific phosphodiesterase class I)
MADAELAFALEGKPLVEFQPAVDLATGRLLGFEALARWDHPSRGFIPPSILIPWAEANDQILALNAWVLAEACRQAEQWPSGIQLAVNCSIVQLRQQQGAIAVAAALEESGLNPDRLSVEVTERTVTDRIAATDLRALEDLGVHVTVEDVGTSWSTIENLREFAIETAKISKKFILNLELHEGMNRAIVEAIINISHSLSMSTVAMGVETEQQLRIVQALGADVAQGFYFAAPMSSDHAHALANSDPRVSFALAGQATASDDAASFDAAASYDAGRERAGFAADGRARNEPADSSVRGRGAPTPTR